MLLVEAAGARSLLGVPMLKENELIGAIVIYRQEVRPFTDKQIALVEELRRPGRHRHREHAAAQRIAAIAGAADRDAEVLSVISSSPGDLEPVFQAMLENATRICEAKFGTLIRFDGDAITTSQHKSLRRQNMPNTAGGAGRIKPTPGGLLDSVIRTKREQSTRPTRRLMAFLPLRPTLGGARTLLVVPMLKEDELIGAISIYRQEVRPFTDKQIELVKNFAAQAVIAIENTRLLNELRQRTDDLTESLEQQTATSEVLRVISSSPGELEPVFQAMLENATRICEGKFGTLFLCEEDAFRVVAQNLPPALSELRQRERVVRPGPWSSLVRSSRTKQVVQIADLRADKGYFERDPLRVTLIEVGGIRSSKRSDAER